MAQDQPCRTRARQARKQQKCELAAIDRELAEDVVVGANAGLVDEVVLQHVGPAPSGPVPDVRVLWDEAAGCIVQHRAPFGVTRTSLLCEKSRIVIEPGSAASWQVASQASDCVARALGWQLTIQPPHPSRGLSR